MLSPCASPSLASTPDATAPNTIFGHTGDDAVAFKTAELTRLYAAGTQPRWMFGNTSSDAETYAKSGLDASRRVFVQYTDAAHGGRRIEAWRDLLAEADAGPDVCRAP